MIQSETAIGGTPVAYGFEWGEPWKLIPVVCPLWLSELYSPTKTLEVLHEMFT